MKRVVYVSIIIINNFLRNSGENSLFWHMLLAISFCLSYDTVCSIFHDFLFSVFYFEGQTDIILKSFIFFSIKLHGNYDI